MDRQSFEQQGHPDKETLKQNSSIPVCASQMSPTDLFLHDFIIIQLASGLAPLPIFHNICGSSG